MNIGHQITYMKRVLTLALTLALASSALAWPFGPKGDSNAEKKANIRRQRDEMLTQLFSSNPDMKKVLKKAAGYATFKQVNVNLFLLATANGYGLLVDNQARRETFMRMGSLGGGIGAGVKDVRVIFVFHDAKVMKQFVEEGWQFGGQADAAAKYHQQISDAVSPVRGAQFLQVENQMAICGSEYCLGDAVSRRRRPAQTVTDPVAACEVIATAMNTLKTIIDSDELVLFGLSAVADRLAACQIKERMPYAC